MATSSPSYATLRLSIEALAEVYADQDIRKLERATLNAYKNGLAPNHAETAPENDRVDLSTGIVIDWVDPTYFTNFENDEEYEKKKASIEAVFRKFIEEILARRLVVQNVYVDHIAIEIWDNGPDNLSMSVVFLLKQPIS